MKKCFFSFLCVIIVSMVLWERPSLAAPSTPDTPAHFMGMYEFAWNNLDTMVQWKDVLNRRDAQKEKIQKCMQSPRNCDQPEISLWNSIILAMRPLPSLQKLLRVNTFINSLILPQTSAEAYVPVNISAKSWQTPLEFLQAPLIPDNAALVKYFALREAGFPEDKLRITVTRDVLRNIRHMVLTASVDGQIYILDTRSNAVMRQGDFTNHILYYSFNERMRWAYVPIPTDSVFSSQNGPVESPQEKLQK